VDLHPAIAIVNEAQLPKSVQEKADPRAGRAHHLREGLLTHLGDYNLGYPSLPKWASKSKTRASLFSLELKRWSTKSSSYRMFRISK
jgi:hypothetical protein